MDTLRRLIEDVLSGCGLAVIALLLLVLVGGKYIVDKTTEQESIRSFAIVNASANIGQGLAYIGKGLNSFGAETLILQYKIMVAEREAQLKELRDARSEKSEGEADRNPSASLPVKPQPAV